MTLAVDLPPYIHDCVSFVQAHLGWSGFLTGLTAIVSSRIVKQRRLSRLPTSGRLCAKDAATVPRLFWGFVSGWFVGRYEFLIQREEARQRWEMVRDRTKHKLKVGHTSDPTSSGPFAVALGSHDIPRLTIETSRTKDRPSQVQETRLQADDVR